MQPSKHMRRLGSSCQIAGTMNNEFKPPKALVGCIWAGYISIVSWTTILAKWLIDHHIHHSSIYASVYPLYPSSVCWLIINSEHLCHLSQLSIFIPFFLVFVSISNQTYPILSAFSVAFPHHQLHISVLEIPWYEPLKDMESCFGIWHVIIYIHMYIYIAIYIYIQMSLYYLYI